MIPYKDIGAKYDYGWNSWDINHSKQVIKLALQIRNELIKLGILSGSPSDEYILEATGYLHDIGRNPNSKGKGEHNEKSYYTLKQELSPEDLMKEETNIILDCILFHTNDLWQNWRKMTPKKSEHGMKLAAIFRTGDALDYSLTQCIKEVSLIQEENGIKCRILPFKSSASIERQRAKQKSDLFEDVFGKSIEFTVEKG